MPSTTPPDDRTPDDAPTRPAPAHSAVGSPVVDTVHGPVRGRDDGVVKVWRGIRYAAAPVGGLRWRAPEPPQPWREPMDAIRVGPACPQPADPRIPLDLGAAIGEDCLNLNVWASSDTEPGDRKPVLVWVHGGAYVIGAASQPLYHGRELVRRGDVVLVTLNYRLGAFGFLELTALSSGRRRFDTNVGLRDVLFALAWVRDNIAAFGGDPDRVTLFGESAGGGIVTTLLGSPAAAGLFHRAIAQSSPATSCYGTERAIDVAEQFLGHLGLSPRDVDRLPDVPVAAIVEVSKHVFDDVPARRPGTLAFAPIVDGDIVPDYPVALARAGRTLPVPLVIGTNKDEASLFRWMKSPLLPITPDAIKKMFADIAAEQPGLRLPTETQISAAYRRQRGKRLGVGVASDIGFRMPSVWFAEGHTAVAPPTCTGSTGRRRRFGYYVSAPRTRPNCRTCSVTSTHRRIRRSPWAVAAPAVRCPNGSAPAGSTSPSTGDPTVRPGSRAGTPTTAPNARVCSSTGVTGSSATSTSRSG